MSAFSGGLHYQLEQIFARSFNPLLDLLCELFLSPEELRRQRDRSQRLKTLTRQLQRYTTADPMPMVLSRLLVSNLLFVRQQANLLRHFVPGSKIEPVKPQVTERLFELALSLLGWQQQEDNPDRKAKFAQAAAIASEIYDLYYETLREASFPGLPPRESFPVVTPAMASQGSSVGSRGSSLSPEWLPTDRFVPPSRSPPKPQPVPPPTQDPPQGQTLQYYKDHGYSQFMREVQLMFLSGSFSHEPCRVVRYNGKNNALCFFPETGASHYISCQIPLMWTRLGSTQG